MRACARARASLRMPARTRVRSVHNSTQPERAGHALRSVDWCSYTHEFVARINHGTFVCGNGGMLLNDYFALHSHDTDALYHILRKGVNPTTPNCYVVSARSSPRCASVHTHAHSCALADHRSAGRVCGLRTLA